jgi:hypothetical protein
MVVNYRYEKVDFRRPETPKIEKFFFVLGDSLEECFEKILKKKDEYKGSASEKIIVELKFKEKFEEWYKTKDHYYQPVRQVVIPHARKRQPIFF